MEGLSIEDLHSTLQKFIDITLCAVCLEKVQSDLVQCINGHLICADCKGELLVCPTCREAFSNVRPPNIIFEVIEALPSRCIHNDCIKLLMPDDEHEKYCGFRFVNCNINDCNWEGRAQNVRQHVSDEHLDDVIFSDSNNITSTIVLEDFNPEEHRLVVKALLLEKEVFWLNVINNIEKKLLLITVIFVPNGKPTIDFVAKFYHKSDEKFQYKINLNLDPDIQTDDVNYVPVPKYMLTNIVKDNNLSFDITIKMK